MIIDFPGGFSEKNNVETGPDLRLIATTDDPQLIFKPDSPLAPGWYKFFLDMDSAVRPSPRVYFDFGWGFSEAFSSGLKPAGDRGGFVATLKLPFPTIVLRLDPTNTTGEFRLGALSIEPLSRIRAGARLAQHGVRLFASDPKAFVARLPEFWKAVRQPRFIQMRDIEPLRGTTDYATWIREHDYLTSRDREGIVAQVASLGQPPLISVVMPVYNTPENLLDAAIGSVVNQVYPHWELCIADDCSTLQHVRPTLKRWQLRDARIKVTFRPHNGHIANATNSAFELATGDWIALLDHDDILREHALAEVAVEINRHRDAQIIYSDEDKLDGKGRRYGPYFKPDFSRELFRSQNYLNHLTVHRADNIRAVGGWRPGFEGSQDYDLNLRILERIDLSGIRHIPKVLYHWRAAEGSTAAAGSEKSYAYAAGFRALEEHIERTRLQASVEAAPDTPFYRIRMKVPESEPLISVIIPTRDRVDILRVCVESIRAKTTYKNYEIIIVDNDSREADTISYFRELKSSKNARILRYAKPFNYSAINNFAVDKARGALVALVNNDIEVISPDWLTEMVSWAIQPDVGCVGAKLYYSDDTVQHAGVILGIGGVAGHSHKHAPRASHGYFARLKILQNVSAVTAACLVVRKATYEAVGGFDAEHLAVAFNDVDFCLKVREAGFMNVWTPYAELYHHESVSRGAEDSPEKMARFQREVMYMKGVWKDKLTDPFYSPHLTLDREDFSL